MFEKLRQALREAVDNFKTELSRDDVPETVDAILRAMEKEAAGTKVDVERLRKEIEVVTVRAKAQKKEADVCRRREKMANDIGDAETAEVARTFAEKHERHVDVLVEKRAVLEDELRLRESEFAEMIEKLKEARASRSSLEAQAGRSDARRTLNETDDLFSELDRMAEKIQDNEAHGEAAESFDEVLSDTAEFDAELERAAYESEEDARMQSVEDRLEELKRKMDQGS